MSAAASRVRWASRLGLILAVTGSAVGLGNFLRFPGQVAANGGGAFLVPYFCAFLLLGLPILWIEWSLGRMGGRLGSNSMPGTLRAIAGGARWAAHLGVLGPVITLMIYTYYVFIEGWCLAYAWSYASGAMAGLTAGAAVGECFAAVTGAAADGAVFAPGNGTLLACVATCVVLNLVIIYRGVVHGIEWFCRWAMPLLAACAVVIVVRVLTLGTPDPAQPERNVMAGLAAMWEPRDFWAVLAQPRTWLAAAGQIFFTLSLGMGVILTYATYMKPDDDVALSGLTAASGNEFCEVVLGGMMTIPAAFIFLGPAIISSPPGTFGMGFVALPSVFLHMPGGQFFGGVFFLLLFLAAMTSSLSMLQPSVSFLEDGLGLGRRAAVAFLGFITLVGTMLVAWFSKGYAALGTLDFWTGNLGICVVALIQVVFFGWVLGIGRGMDEMRRGAEIRLPPGLGFIIRYVTPLFLIAILVAWLRQDLNDAKGTLRSLGDQPGAILVTIYAVAVVALFLVLAGVAVRRWERRDAERQEVQP